MNKIKTLTKEYFLIISFFVSFLGVVGSLYISEIVGIVPCVLCYWQRIFLYPIAVISLVALVRKDNNVVYYILPLTVLGTLFSTYHNLLQATDIFNYGEGGCDASGVSCAVPTEAFRLGNLFVSLEFLSLIAFLTITSITSLYVWISRKERD